MMFEMYIDGDEGRRRIGIVPYLPADISEDYPEALGQVSFSIMPAVTKSTEDLWESVVDLSVDEALTLRDALTMAISHLERNPATKP